jgi:hypothetical protein
MANGGFELGPYPRGREIPRVPLQCLFHRGEIRSGNVSPGSVDDDVSWPYRRSFQNPRGPVWLPARGRVVEPPICSSPLADHIPFSIAREHRVVAQSAGARVG